MRPGLKIKVKRVEKEIKQHELAEKVGISRQYLRLIEGGKAQNPSNEVMKKISQELNTSVQDLFFQD